MTSKLTNTYIDGMYKIAVPTPFRVGPVNCYLLEGDKLTLVDTGPRTEAAYNYLKDALQERGYAVSDIERLVITHHHIDHLGLAGRIFQESKAQVICHTYCARYLDDQDATYSYYLKFVNGIYREAGVPKRIIDTMENAKDWYDMFGSASVSDVQKVDEGDTITMAGHGWRIYHTPGHAGDLITFYQPQTQILLASDHIIQKISSNPLLEPAPTVGETRPRRLIEYLEQLQRIANLDISIAYSGHGSEVRDVPALVQKRIEFHNNRAASILQLFEGNAHNLWEMTEKLFSQVGDDDKYLALSEVLGHIDMLERDGKLTRQYRDGVVFWQPN